MAEDARLRAQMTIRKDPKNGRRQIVINGQVFPTFTRGDVDVEPVVSWKDQEGGALDDPVIVGYEVTVRCFVPNLDIQDPEVLKEIPLPESVDPDRFV